MFERYSEAARLALFAARLEASEAASHAIEPAHLLLGLLEAKGWVAATLGGARGSPFCGLAARERPGQHRPGPAPVTIQPPKYKYQRDVF